MSFLVEQTPRAENQLADLWLQADSAGRSAITAAAHRITTALARSNAPTLGVSSPIGQLPTARRLDDPPLSAIYVVMATVGRVVILDYFAFGAP